VSGVGHETDFTLLDFVSNIRAETPTAAAEIVSEGASKLRDYLDFMSDSLNKKMNILINNFKEKIDFLRKLLRSPKQKIQDQYLKLDHKSEQLNLTFKKFIQRKQDGLEKEKLKLIFNSPKNIKDKGQDKLKEINKMIHKQLTSLLYSLNLKLNNFEQQLISLSPKEILKRGYSITYNEKGKIIKSSKKLAGGDRLVTQLSDGKVQSKVE
jgi:exodeoxyribonuclease VII large subunit